MPLTIDTSKGVLISEIAALKTRFEGKIQKLNTQEVKLDSLGSFPLPKEAKGLLEATVTQGGLTLAVPEILKKSQIPIFTDPDRKLAFISAEGKSICRYFFDLWRLDSEEDLSENDEILAGFTILASYAGI